MGIVARLSQHADLACRGEGAYARLRILHACCDTPPDACCLPNHPRTCRDTRMSARYNLRVICSAGLLRQLAQYSSTSTRTERDTFGPLQVPADKCVTCAAPKLRRKATSSQHHGSCKARASIPRAEVTAGTGAPRRSDRCRTSRSVEPLSECLSPSYARLASRSVRLPRLAPYEESGRLSKQLASDLGLPGVPLSRCTTLLPFACQP